MVLDILLELLADLGIIGLRKKKKKSAEQTSPKTIDTNQGKDVSGRTSEEGLPVCAGCHRIVERGAIYELRKAWCVDCYKSYVLKVRE